MASGIKWVIGWAKKIFIAVTIYTIIVAAYISFNAPKNIEPQDYFKVTTTPLYEEFYKPENNKTAEQKQRNKILSLFACRAVGELCSPDQEPGSTAYLDKSALGGLARLMVTPYMNAPASGILWAVDGLQKIGIAPKTFAAEGIGMSGMRPFIGIWTMLRNVTYLLLTLLVVAIGLMIMFRLKINPQTVVTLENSLPRIVITIILITFSFPITGLMIDLMYAVMLIGISIFAAVDPTHFNAGELNGQYVTAGMGVIWDGFFPTKAAESFNDFARLPLGMADLGSALIDVLPATISNTLRVVTATAITFAVVKAFTSQSDGLAKPIISMFNGAGLATFQSGEISGGVLYVISLILIWAVTLPFALTYGGGLVLGLFIWITLVALFFRIVVMLFASYLRIILYTIFSPLLILPTALPGRNGFAFWLRSLTGELAVFPTVVILLLVGRLIVMAFTLSAADVYSFSNWFRGGSEGVWTPPFLWGLNQRSLAIIIGMQIIFLIPSIAGLVRQKISGNKGLPFKTGAGIFFAGMTGLTAGALGGAGKFGTLGHGIKSAGDLKHTKWGKALLSKLPGAGGAHKSADQVSQDTN